MSDRCLYDIMTVSEASAYLRVGVRTVRRYCDEGKLHARESDAGWLILASSVYEMMDTKQKRKKNK